MRLAVAMEEGARRPTDKMDSARSGRAISRTERVAPESGPLFARCNVAPTVSQLTFTWMLFGFASGFFGRWRWSTPCFDSARIFSESMLAGSEKARVNVP